MSHNPGDIYLPEMPLPPELPADGNFVLTATEVRVLTEAALRLGRKDAAEKIADACAARAKISQRAPESMTGVREGMFVTWLAAEKLAREIGEA